jgi:hypothetical protein
MRESSVGDDGDIASCVAARSAPGAANPVFFSVVQSDWVSTRRLEWFMQYIRFTKPARDRPDGWVTVHCGVGQV